MAFWDSLSQWFKGGAPAQSDDEGFAVDNAERARRRTSLGTESETHFAPGVQCLLAVTERRFMVEILELDNTTMRVSFPGIDYPVSGMMVDLELHDHGGFSYYQTRVVTGPQKEGDGIVLERPQEGHRNRHRDSCRVPTDIDAEVKDQVRVRKHPAKIRNLSTGGALLETEAVFETGNTLEMTAHIPGESPAELMAQVLHVMEPRDTDTGRINAYGTRFVGYEPGHGRAVTRYIWQRLKELYPST